MPTPEQQARDQIDRMPDAAGWAVQNAAAANLSAGGEGEPRVGRDRGGKRKGCAANLIMSDFFEENG